VRQPLRTRAKSLPCGILLLFVLTCTAARAQDAREIVLRSISLDERFSEIARNYTFIQHVEQRDLDSGGKVKRISSKDYDVTMLEGSPYIRLIRRDGKPLSPEEERKEQDKLAKSIADRRSESPAERAARLEDWKNREERRRAPLREIPEAFQLRLEGLERIDGREVYVIEATPRPGYHGKDRISKHFPKLKGKLWIDKESYEWVKVEAEVLDTVTYGFILVRVQPGTKLVIEQSRINGEVWLPKRFEANGVVRLGLIRKLRLQYLIDFTDYRKFQTESRVVGAEPIR
jgi:hypothetical protein